MAILLLPAFFPNPVYAKVGFSPEVALRGFRYVASFALTFVTPLLLLPAAGYVAWREAPKPVALALGTLSLAFPAYAVVVGRGLDGHGTVSSSRFRLRSAIDGMVGG